MGVAMPAIQMLPTHPARVEASASHEARGLPSPVCLYPRSFSASRSSRRTTLIARSPHVRFTPLLNSVADSQALAWRAGTPGRRPSADDGRVTGCHEQSTTRLPPGVLTETTRASSRYLSCGANCMFTLTRYPLLASLA